jgi:hypothetical protein
VTALCARAQVRIGEPWTRTRDSSPRPPTGSGRWAGSAIPHSGGTTGSSATPETHGWTRCPRHPHPAPARQAGRDTGRRRGRHRCDRKQVHDAPHHGGVTATRTGPLASSTRAMTPCRRGYDERARSATGIADVADTALVDCGALPAWQHGGVSLGLVVVSRGVVTRRGATMRMGRLAVRAVFVGVAATAMMDIAGEVIRRTSGVEPLDYRLLGRRAARHQPRARSGFCASNTRGYSRTPGLPRTTSPPPPFGDNAP